MIGSEVSSARHGASNDGFVRGFADASLDASGREARSYARPLSDSAVRRVSEADAWFEDDECARFILDMKGHVLRANASAKALAASGMIGSGGVFICSRHRSRGELDRLLERLAARRQSKGRILFRAGDDAWCTLDLMTSSRAPGRIFAVARPVKCLDAERVDSMAAVFGLTRAEKTILIHLADGEAPKDIGRVLDMSIHTVRSHLRSICMRMGVKGINGALRLTLQMC
ncbi:DNA-binding CsgD family transcriptional regulator [Brevundimonas faecalis]|uniref:DNA-binding CsgD family transcriptional regulator n=1 Tax=Brevundimonas faecalis TaxID=947378 RepID=A0ABV2R8Q4_9CAUL